MTDSDEYKGDSEIEDSQEAAPSPQGVSFIGKEIEGKYKIQEVLGSGGMGIVYKAEQIFLDRVVAIKFLHPHLIQDESYLSRFKREARAASRLNHPNAAILYDYGAYNRVPYLVMEYVQGKTLKDILRDDGAQPFSEVKNIMLQTTSALIDAHKSGIIHRDLKPENIMVCKRPDGKDHVKILDFGIAKLLPQAGDETQTVKTQVGTLIGTPRYASPEQVLGKPLDQRTDIYSLGIIIYEALSGTAPFDAPSIIECFFKHVNEEPKPLTALSPSLNIPAELNALVLKCLAKKPEDRFQTAAELHQALLDIHSGGTTIENAPVVIVKGSGKFLIWATLIVGGVIGLIILIWFLARKPFSEIQSTTTIDSTAIVNFSSAQSSSLSEGGTVAETIEIAPPPDAISESSASEFSSSSMISITEAENLLVAAEQDYRNRNYNEAIIKFEQALTFFPNHKKPFLSYGICLQRVARFDDALKQFESALALDPSWPPTLFNLACFYSVTGNVEKSLEFLQKAVTLDPRVKVWAKNEPDLELIKNDARFIRITGK